MAVYDWKEKPRVNLGATGCEPPLSELEEGFLDTIRRFSRDVVRPVGEKLDKMTPEQVMEEGSPYWDFRKEYLQLGLNPVSLGELSAEERGRLMPMVFEEIGWGDGGLAVTIGACQLPPGLSLAFEKPHLLESFPVDLIGCWAITEPDHGSDMIDPGREVFHANGKYGRPNCVVKFEGDTFVINGQKSAWVSNGPIADVCVLYSACDSGDGPDPVRGCVVIVPMDAPGVSRGLSIDKLGQRALPQGEVYFNDVRLPMDYLIAGPEHYSRAVYAVHAEANTQMSAIFTGVARAAFELAWQYAHDRKQGGVPIIRHQSVQQRLFHMYRKVEASRALARRVALYNNVSPCPALQSAMAAKVTATQTAFEVASEALQMFGGNGNTREYPIEKIFRDARASLIEDGCNEVLSIKGGCYLMDQDQFNGS